MQSWRYHLFYWGASVLSVAGYNATRVAENWNMEIFQGYSAGLFAISFFLYFVLLLYGSLQRTHHVVFAVTYVLGLAIFPHHYIVRMSKIFLAVLLVCAFYRIAAGPMAHRKYSEVRH
ncbi:hypothetical protein VFPPC_12871 [Pochonia chlamydosporia 170]|uniref:Uncharacterized protein n=1 Tax=Pochonia chlamydosporia 170 TaxID=1380566 RepID=A0A179G6P4_METCM|nr:hypothetical protein VFPPC_12871 [Pochonia chlamydosporia 170]OAQ72849.1 hypothetical protein VFPPC_12871 [Pochonia chlamydosporia 170]